MILDTYDPDLPMPPPLDLIATVALEPAQKIINITPISDIYKFGETNRMQIAC